MLLQELNNYFSEANIDFLLCMARLNPSNSFEVFDKEKLIRLAKFYPFGFLGTDILALDSQLQNYILSNYFLFHSLIIKLVSTLSLFQVYPCLSLTLKSILSLSFLSGCWWWQCLWWLVVVVVVALYGGA